MVAQHLLSGLPGPKHETALCPNSTERRHWSNNKRGQC